MDELTRDALSANQLVALNLRRARELRGYTQDEAAEQLAPYLGSLWSKANFSAAERSLAGARIRNFTADEVLAFSLAFDLPIIWFFLPPGGGEHALDVAAPRHFGIDPAAEGLIEFLEPYGPDDLRLRLSPEEMLRQILLVNADELEWRLGPDVVDEDSAASLVGRLIVEFAKVEAIADHAGTQARRFRELADLFEQAASRLTGAVVSDDVPAALDDDQEDADGR